MTLLRWRCSVVGICGLITLLTTAANAQSGSHEGYQRPGAIEERLIELERQNAAIRLDLEELRRKEALLSEAEGAEKWMPPALISKASTVR